MTEKTSSKLSTINSEVLLFNTQIANINIHHPKIRDFNDRGMQELRKRLNAMIFALGFKNAVEIEILNAMGKLIKKEFGDFCLEDLAIAFRMAAAGKLPGIVRHYQTFDMQYLGDVCNAFSKYRIGELKLAKEHEKQKERDEEIENSADIYDHSDRDWYELIEKAVKEQKKLPFYADYQAAYKHAESEGLIKLAGDKKKQFLKAVISEMHKEIVRHETGMEQREQLRDILASKSKMKKECRARYMKKYFTDKIKQDEKS